MRKQSHTVPRRRQSASPASRHLPLVDILIDAQAELQELRGGPQNSDSLLRWDPDPGEGVWHATEETELSC